MELGSIAHACEEPMSQKPTRRQVPALIAGSAAGFASGGFSERPAQPAADLPTLTNLLVTGSARTTTNNAFAPDTAARADAFPYAPPGGHVPGDHLRAGSLFNFKSVRGDDCQEVGLAVMLQADTGKTKSTSINNGKTCFSYGTNVTANGGNGWGAAGGIITEHGAHGFFAAHEIDTTYRHGNAAIGQGNAMGLFFNSINETLGTAQIYGTGNAGKTGGACWDAGLMFSQGASPYIRGTGIFLDCSAEAGFRTNTGRSMAVAGLWLQHDGACAGRADGSYANGAFIDYSTGPIGFDVQGAKRVSDFMARSSAPIGLTVVGNRQTGIDLTNAKAAHAMKLADGQAISFDPAGGAQISGAAGTLRLKCGSSTAAHFTSTAMTPGTGSTISLGSGSSRFANLFLSNNPSIASDQRLKSDLSQFTDAQLDRWDAVRYGLFQYLAAIEKKGAEEARLHAGVIAQDVVSALGEDAFRYGVVGRDPLTRLVQRKRIVQVPATEDAVEVETVIEVLDGRATRRMVERTVKRPVFHSIPLFDEDGKPVTTSRRRLDQNGNPVAYFDLLTREPNDHSDEVQAMHLVPVMIEVEEMYETEEPDLDAAGVQRSVLTIRYEQAAIWEAAYQRRRADRLEARITALEAKAEKWMA